MAAVKLALLILSTTRIEAPPVNDASCRMIFAHGNEVVFVGDWMPCPSPPLPPVKEGEYVAEILYAWR